MMSTILSAKTVTTRKPHACWGCGIKYPPGTEMKVVTSADRGLDTVYWCRTCQEYCNRYLEPDDVVVSGELRFEDPEGWEAIRQELEQKGETTQ